MTDREEFIREAERLMSKCLRHDAGLSDAISMGAYALQSAYERGRKVERDRCQMIVRDEWPMRANILAAIMKENGDE